MRRSVVVAAIAAIGLAGCGSSSPSSTTHASGVARKPAPRKPPPVALRPSRPLSLPAPREGTAATLFGGSIYVSGGISAAGTSTDTVFRIDPTPRADTGPLLPSPVHDAAAAEVGGRLLVFGGGVSEGSDRIVQLLPGTPHLVGTLPQALSDLDAATIGNLAYVAGGWNGTVTSPDIYAVRYDGTVSHVGTLPLGVRYPAVAALGNRLVVAGGETTAGTPTTTASLFDPATGRLTRLPPLPVATDHAAGSVLNGRFYLIGGERSGVFTTAILSWAPGESRWRAAGHLPVALADLAAVPFEGGIATLGGRGSSGTVSTGALLTPAG